MNDKIRIQKLVTELLQLCKTPHIAPEVCSCITCRAATMIRILSAWNAETDSNMTLALRQSQQREAELRDAAGEAVRDCELNGGKLRNDTKRKLERLWESQP